jgi:rod shape-determining protein MreC
VAGLLPPVDRRGSLLLGVCATLSLLLLVVGDRLPTAALRGAGAFLFSPLDRVVLVADRLAASWRENQSLHMRLAQLEVENERLRSAGVENRVLRQQLDLPPPSPMALRPVEVLALAGEPVPTSATLSAGVRAHVKVGDAVLTRDGLLGRVSESYVHQSRVTLLTDPGMAVACEIESTSVLGILHFFAAPRPRLLLTGVPASDTVRVGERVITSGLSRRFPRAIPVGVVSRVGSDPSGLTQEIEVEPDVRLSRLRHAFVSPVPPALDGDAP